MILLATHLPHSSLLPNQQLHVHTHVHTHTHTRTHTHARTHARTHAHTHTYICESPTTIVMPGFTPTHTVQLNQFTLLQVLHLRNVSKQAPIIGQIPNSCFLSTYIAHVHTYIHSSYYELIIPCGLYYVHIQACLHSNEFL